VNYAWELTDLSKRLMLLATALLFSTGGAAIKLASVSSWQVAGYRAGIAAVVLWFGLPHARRSLNWQAILIGCAHAATFILFVTANRLTTATNAVLLQSTYPFYVLLLGPLVLKEKLTRLDLCVMAAVLAGTGLIMGGTEQAAGAGTNPPAGNIAGLLAGVTWAITLTGFRWLSRRKTSGDTAGATMIAGNLIAFVVCLPMALQGKPMEATDLAVVAYLGVFQVGLAYILLTHALPAVPVVEATTLLLAEPVFNPVWTWMLHHEKPSGMAIAGGVVILLAALGGTWVRSKSPAAPVPAV
jgi:drug/metabolite transporter (DMT)-like permease